MWSQLFFRKSPEVSNISNVSNESGFKPSDVDITFGSIGEIDHHKVPPIHHIWFGSKDNNLEYSENLPKYEERRKLEH